MEQVVPSLKANRLICAIVIDLLAYNKPFVWNPVLIQACLSVRPCWYSVSDNNPKVIRLDLSFAYVHLVDILLLR